MKSASNTTLRGGLPSPLVPHRTPVEMAPELAGACRKGAPIPQAMEDIEKQLARLHEIIGTVEHTFAPVVAPHPAEPLKDAAPQPPGLLGELQGNARSIGTARDRLLALREGCQL